LIQEEENKRMLEKEQAEEDHKKTAYMSAIANTLAAAK